MIERRTDRLTGLHMPNTREAVSVGDAQSLPVRAKGYVPNSDQIRLQRANRFAGGYIPKKSGALEAYGDHTPPVGMERYLVDHCHVLNVRHDSFSAAKVPEPRCSVPGRGNDLPPVGTEDSAVGLTEMVQRYGCKAARKGIPDLHGPVHTRGDHPAAVRTE